MTMASTVKTWSALQMSPDTRLSPPIRMNGKSYLCIFLAALTTVVSSGICPHGTHRIITNIITGGLCHCWVSHNRGFCSPPSSRIDKIRLADDNTALFFCSLRRWQVKANHKEIVFHRYVLFLRVSRCPRTQPVKQSSLTVPASSYLHDNNASKQCHQCMSRGHVSPRFTLAALVICVKSTWSQWDPTGSSWRPDFLHGQPSTCSSCQWSLISTNQLRRLEMLRIESSTVNTTLRDAEDVEQTARPGTWCHWSPCSPPGSCRTLPGRRLKANE